MNYMHDRKIAMGIQGLSVCLSRQFRDINQVGYNHLFREYRSGAATKSYVPMWLG